MSLITGTRRFGGEPPLGERRRGHPDDDVVQEWDVQDFGRFPQGAGDADVGFRRLRASRGVIVHG